MYGTQRGTTNGYSLFNFMVLNDSSATPTTFKPEISPIPNKTFLKCQNNTIRYSIPLGNSVRLEAFDAQGKLTALVDGFQTSGSHEVDLSGKIGRGLYIFMLTTGGRKITTMQIRL
jgi:hypothetical protein